MKCSKCNNFVHDLAVVCPYCGVDFPVESREIPQSFVLDRRPEPNICTPPQAPVNNTDTLTEPCAYNDNMQKDAYGDINKQCVGVNATNVPPVNPYLTQQAITPDQYYQNYYQNIVNNYNKAKQEKDVPKESLEALCALFPLIGLILYLVNQEKKPNCAKKYGKVALWGLAISGIIYVVSFILTFLVMVLGMYGLSAGFAG